MFCPKCGKELVEGNQFCSSCGAEIGVPSTTGVPEPGPGQVVQPQVAQPPVYPAVAKKKSNAPLIIGVVVGVVAIVVAILLLLMFVILIPSYNSGQKNAKKRTCQANLRTIDGAIAGYNAETEKNPDSVKALVQAGYMKKVPTCPSGPEPYELVGEGAILEASCPNDPSHNL